MENDKKIDTVLYLRSTKIPYLIAYSCIFLLAPLAIKNFIQGYTILGLSTSLFLMSLIIDIRAVQTGKELPIPINLVLILMTICIIGTVYFLGIYGVFWTYPALIAIYFVRPRKIANILGVLLSICVSYLAFISIDPQIAIRLFASLGITIIIVNVIVSVISSLESELLDQNIKDPLTGAFNRRYMDTCLKDALEQYKRTKYCSSIMMIDIDHFKHINDRYGHDNGDRVLIKMVSLIKSNTRKTDLLFRIGGEEFILLVRNTKQKEVFNHAESLRKVIDETQLLPNHAVTISIGICEVSNCLSVEQWIKRADIALYQAKETGRNKVSQA